MIGWWAAAADSAPPKADAAPPLTLAQLVAGDTKIVDLTYPLNSRNAFWPAPGYHAFELKTIATLEKNGVLSKEFSTPEHLGTHLDAPNHFEKDRPSVAEIPAQDLFAEGVVIDISVQAGQDADYRLTVDDIADWEKQHGRIPNKAVVLLNTGWGKYWEQFARYKNQDVQGRLHFPSYSAEAAKFLIAERQIRGLGVDTLSIDYGLSKDFAVHHLVNGASRYGLENVAHLDQLPPRGFYLVVAPIKIEAGTGGPTRLFAILPK
jgi:kynurenine formamidase